MLGDAILLIALNTVSVFGCHYERIANCTKRVQQELQYERLSLAANIQDLEVYCDQMRIAHRCIELEIDACSDNLKESYQRAMHSEKIVMADVCTPGQAQQDYLKHAPCFRKMLLGGGSCHVAYTHLMTVTGAMEPSQRTSDVNSELNQIVDERVIADVCCAYHSLHECYMANTARDCGPKALEISLRSLEKLNGGMEQSCSKVKRSCAGLLMDSSTSHVGSENMIRAENRRVLCVGLILSLGLIRAISL